MSAPNPQLQRTRMRSPLSRQPLGKGSHSASIEKGWKMRVQAAVIFFLVSVACTSTSSTQAGDENDPCMSQWEGMSLNDNLYVIDSSARALSLLNGCENPKLKRLLEMNLVFASSMARQAIDHKAA